MKRSWPQWPGLSRPACGLLARLDGAGRATLLSVLLTCAACAHAAGGESGRVSAAPGPSLVVSAAAQSAPDLVARARAARRNAATADTASSRNHFLKLSRLYLTAAEQVGARMADEVQLQTVRDRLRGVRAERRQLQVAVDHREQAQRRQCMSSRGRAATARTLREVLAYQGGSPRQRRRTRAAVARRIPELLAHLQLLWLAAQAMQVDGATLRAADVELGRARKLLADRAPAGAALAQAWTAWIAVDRALGSAPVAVEVIDELMSLRGLPLTWRQRAAVVVAPESLFARGRAGSFVPAVQGLWRLLGQPPIVTQTVAEAVASRAQATDPRPARELGHDRQHAPATASAGIAGSSGREPTVAASGRPARRARWLLRALAGGRGAGLGRGDRGASGAHPSRPAHRLIVRIP